MLGQGEAIMSVSGHGRLEDCNVGRLQLQERQSHAVDGCLLDGCCGISHEGLDAVQQARGSSKVTCTTGQHRNGCYRKHCDGRSCSRQCHNIDSPAVRFCLNWPLRQKYSYCPAHVTEAELRANRHTGCPLSSRWTSNLSWLLLHWLSAAWSPWNRYIQ